jgi:hypothetical protein
MGYDLERSYLIVESDLKNLIDMIMGSCTFGDSPLSSFFFVIDDSHLIKKKFSFW